MGGIYPTGGNRLLNLLCYSVPRSCWGTYGGEQIAGVQWIAECGVVPRVGDYIVIFDRESKDACFFGEVLRPAKPYHHLRVRCLGSGAAQWVRWREEQRYCSVAVAREVQRRFS